MSTAHRRSTFETLRQTILAVIPEPEQGLSSGVPILRLAGTPIAGFSAAKTWLSYLPHSGDVIASLTDEELAGFNTSKGSVEMPIDTPLPIDLIRLPIQARRAEANV